MCRPAEQAGLTQARCSLPSPRDLSLSLGRVFCMFMLMMASGKIVASGVCKFSRLVERGTIRTCPLLSWAQNVQPRSRCGLPSPRDLSLNLLLTAD
ncbi:MAG: hypothetical protein V3R61_01870, partial [candidate division NC10 bacterium]